MSDSQSPSTNDLDAGFNYIRRRGRFTKAQANALQALSDQYRWQAADLQHRPLGMEIGFGMGFELIAWAEQQPNWQLLGVELYQPGIGSMLSRLAKNQLSNVRLVDEPAQVILAQLDNDSLAEVRIFFPDPWPKKRHHKRRLIQPEFLRLLQQKLIPAGIVRLATDWAPYAHWMVEHFAANPGFNLLQDDIRAPTETPPTTVADEVRNVTKFEARGERLGHEIRDLQYQRIN